MANKGGRPTKYSLELAIEICDAIATSSKSIKAICKQKDHFPCDVTIYDWLNKHDEFASLYAKAKKAQISVLVEEIIEISDDKSEDKYIDEEGKVRHNAVAHARNRLQIDTRKWLASKLVPKVYGERLETQVTTVDIAELQRRKEELDEKNKKDY